MADSRFIREVEGVMVAHGVLTGRNKPQWLDRSTKVYRWPSGLVVLIRSDVREVAWYVRERGGVGTLADLAEAPFGDPPKSRRKPRADRCGGFREGITPEYVEAMSMHAAKSTWIKGGGPVSNSTAKQYTSQLNAFCNRLPWNGGKSGLQNYTREMLLEALERTPASSERMCRRFCEDLEPYL